MSTPDAVFEVGTDVLVTGLDGEEQRARVVGHVEARAGDHTLFEDSGDPVTLSKYWGGLVDPGERVVQIKYLYETPEGGFDTSGKVYDFPESAIEVADQ